MLKDDTHLDKWEKETFVVNVCRTGGLVLLTLSACYGDGGADTSNITPKGDALTDSDKVKMIHITQAMIDNSLSDVSAFRRLRKTRAPGASAVNSFRGGSNCFGGFLPNPGLRPND